MCVHEVYYFDTFSPFAKHTPLSHWCILLTIIKLNMQIAYLDGDLQEEDYM